VNRPIANAPVSAPWPTIRQTVAYAAPVRRAGAGDRLAFVVAVLMVLVFSQGWQLPLLGEFPIANGVLAQVGFIPGYLAACLLALLAARDGLKASLRQPFLLVLLGVVAASMLWSIDPATTLRRFVALSFTTLAGMALAGRFSWRALAEVVATAYAILVVSSLVAGALVPRIGVMSEIFPGAWRGLWQEKNVLGGVMAFGFCVLSAAAMLNPRRALLWWGFAALAVLLVLLSQSKTSLVSLMLGAAAVGFIFIVQRGPAIGVAAVWLAVVSAAMLSAFVVFFSDLFFGLLGKDATFTGRTQIWTALMRQIEERPWTGYGYAAVWSDESGRGPFAWITKEAGFTAQHAHNSWLEQWLDLGIIGLAAWGLFYLQTLAMAILAVFRHKGAYLVFPFLMVYTLVTMTESIALTYNDFRWTLFVAFALKLTIPDRDPPEQSV
jgi:exopolysaccharide production protein ExoQ